MFKKQTNKIFSFTFEYSAELVYLSVARGIISAFLEAFHLEDLWQNDTRHFKSACVAVNCLSTFLSQQRIFHYFPAMHLIAIYKNCCFITSFLFLALSWLKFIVPECAWNSPLLFPPQRYSTKWVSSWKIFFFMYIFIIYSFNAVIVKNSSLGLL